MKTRVLTSTYLVIGLILVLLSKFLTPYIFDLAIGALAIMAAIEVGRVFERTRAFNNIYLVGSFPAILYILYIWGFNKNMAWEFYLAAIIIAMIAYFIINFLLTILLKRQTSREMTKYQVDYSANEYALKKSINTSIILIYPTILFMSLIALNHIFDLSIAANISNSFFDFYLIITVFVVTMLTDTFAMFSGMIFKGPKLCPRISPKKTISGAIGGLVGGVIGAFLVYWLFKLNTQFEFAFNLITTTFTVFVFGFIGSIISQLGDIFASWLKRRARVKDYGTIFPGHGGVMDRVDGLIFNATFVFITFLILL